MQSIRRYFQIRRALPFVLMAACASANASPGSFMVDFLRGSFGVDTAASTIGSGVGSIPYSSTTATNALEAAFGDRPSVAAAEPASKVETAVSQASGDPAVTSEPDPHAARQ